MANKKKVAEQVTESHSIPPRKDEIKIETGNISVLSIQLLGDISKKLSQMINLMEK